VSCDEPHTENKGKEVSDVKILICDKENRAIEGKTYLLSCAKKYATDVTIEIVESGEQLLFSRKTEYADADLIYLAYDVPGQNGLKTAQELRRRGFTGDVAFYSYDASHVREVESVNAIGYILAGKGMRKSLEKTFLDAVSHYNARTNEVMMLKHGGEHRNIPIRDILYFEVQHRSVTAHYFQNERVETFSFNSTLSSVEDRLSGKGFLRNHRSYLVAEAYIDKHTFEQIEMTNGDVIPVGRKYTKAVVQDPERVI
jgi:DNA-binding LytR/AlgR family response regulator